MILILISEGPDSRVFWIRRHAFVVDGPTLNSSGWLVLYHLASRGSPVTHFIHFSPGVPPNPTPNLFIGPNCHNY